MLSLHPTQYKKKSLHFHFVFNWQVSDHFQLQTDGLIDIHVMESVYIAFIYARYTPMKLRFLYVTQNEEWKSIKFDWFLFFFSFTRIIYSKQIIIERFAKNFLQSFVICVSIWYGIHLYTFCLKCYYCKCSMEYITSKMSLRKHYYSITSFWLNG